MKVVLLYSVILPPTSQSEARRHPRQIPQPHELRIVRYEGDEGFYLLYCDPNGEEITDDYLEDLESAFARASDLYGLAKRDWKPASQD